MDRLPVIYVRGYAGTTSGIDAQVDDPFYGFNRGSTHVRVDGDGDPSYYQFEGPMLRLMIDEKYQLLVHGDQGRYLEQAAEGELEKASIWVYRFYDQAATTFVAPPHQNVIERIVHKAQQKVTSKGFNIETAAEGLYDLIMLVRRKTGAEKVYVVAHSMGGLVARCMIQKTCLLEDKRADTGAVTRLPAKDIVAKFFTYGTPHGGITFQVSALDWAEKTFGPAGADIFSPPKMYGYLDKDATFGDEPPEGAKWDPQKIAPDIFAGDDIFCLIGTDPTDYGASRVVVGPKSDGLVQIEHAYVRGAHRAFVYKSHSGSYGEVNSEEGYQNLRRFLFGRWRVLIDFDGLPPLPGKDDEQWPVWQADMRLAIRGQSIVMSEQQAAHYCPIQLNDEIQRKADSPDHPVPLVSTFLLDPATIQRQGPADQAVPHAGRARYTMTLRVFALEEKHGVFDFSDHLEQVPAWSDSLIVDVGPNETGTGLQAWTAWKSDVNGQLGTFDPITKGLATPTDQAASFAQEGSDHVCRIELPDAARALPVFKQNAALKVRVRERAG